MSEFIKIGVTGNDPNLWKKLREKLVSSIDKSLDIINQNNQNSIKEEVKQFAASLLEYGKAKLHTPSLQNEKLKAEINMIYAQLETEKANSRKINAEAQKIEFENAVNSLKLALLGMKAIMVGEDGEENVVFLNSIEEFLPFLDNIKIK